MLQHFRLLSDHLQGVVVDGGELDVQPGESVAMPLDNHADEVRWDKRAREINMRELADAASKKR